MTLRASVLAIVGICVAASIVQRGYVEAVDNFERIDQGPVQRIADGGVAALEEGRTAGAGYARGMAELGYRVRVLRNGQVVEDGAPGAGFDPTVKAEATATLDEGSERLVIVNALTGAGRPTPGGAISLRDELVAALWAGAGVAVLTALGLLLLAVLRRRSRRVGEEQEQGERERRGRTDEGGEAGADSA